jgi:glycosyltransferase involved in cell wall biosynthesis
MKILLVTPIFDPCPGGASIYFGLISELLSQKDKIKNIYILSKYIGFEKVYKRNGKITILRYLPDMGKGLRFFSIIKRLVIPFLIFSSAKLLKINLIHYHSLTSYKAIHYLSFLSGTPLICDIRDLAVKNERASLSYYHHAQKIICCSENILQFVHSDALLATKAVYIPIPFEKPEKQRNEVIDRIRKKYRINPDISYLCFVGAIIEYKGIFELIDAFKILREKGYEWQLVVIGPMELKEGSENYRRFQAEIDIPGIIYLGPLEHNETLALIQMCDIFILPSKTEAIGRVGLEAISLGVKVILPSCVPEFKKHCPEYILENIDPPSIANKILEVSEFSKTPTYPLTVHDPSKITDQTFSLYKELLSQ